MDKMCDIVMCVWNNKELVENCVKSIVENTEYPYRIVFVDNASDEPTATYLKELCQREDFEGHIIRNEENLGNTKAVNQGLLFSDAPYVCNLDNDTLATKGWLTELIAIAEKDAQIGIVGPSSGGMYPPKSDSYEDILLKGAELVAHRGQMAEAVTLDGYCMLIKREVIQNVGVWDEIYSPGYFDDTDYCRLVGKNNYRIACAKGSYVYHIEGSSFKKNPRREAIFGRNREIFEERYGKSERILYIVDQEDDTLRDKIEENVYLQARKANWVWVVQKDSLDRVKLQEHSHIKQFSYSSVVFSLKLFFKVLFRKKKFNWIITSNNFLAKLFSAFAFIHHSKIKVI